MKFRDHMIETNDNIGWCVPLNIIAHGKDITITVNEGKLECCQIDGVDYRTYPIGDQPAEMTWEQIARLVNDDYDLCRGYNDRELALEPDWEEGPCCECPYFGICEAMDDDDDWKAEHWDDDDWADYCGSEIDRDMAESMINDFLADYEDLGDDEYRDYVTGEVFKVLFGELHFDLNTETWYIDCEDVLGEDERRDASLYCDTDGNCRFH